MKPMTWVPDEKDTKVNQYLDDTNHAPYDSLILVLLSIFCLFTLVILIGVF